jgi:hypothetical protein
VVPTVRHWDVIEHLGEFSAVCGELFRLDGAAVQRFGFVALEDGRVVYADVVMPIKREPAAPPSPPTPTFHGVPIGVLNDRNWVYHDSHARTVHYDKGDVTFSAAKDGGFRTVELNSPWYNVDDALGIVCLNASGKQVYYERPTSTPGRREQLWCLNDSPRLPAASAIVFYPSQPADKTRRAAGRCKFVAGGDPRKFSVTLEDGKRLDFDLKEFNIETP